MKNRWLAPLAVALLGLAVTWGTFLMVRAQVLRVDQRDFSWVVQELAHDLRARMTQVFAHQMGLAEALSRLPPRFQSEFDRVADRLAPTCGMPCLRGIGYFPRVPSDGMDAWIRAVRASALPGSPQASIGHGMEHIHGLDHFPALFLSPEERNLHLFGRDLLALEGQEAGLKRLLRDGRSVAVTAPLAFDLDAYEGRPGVIVLAPVYEPRALLDTVRRRDRALRALVLVGLSVDAILEDALPSAKRQGVSVRIFDQGPVDGTPELASRAGLLLDTDRPLSRASVHAIPDEAFGRHPFEAVRVLELGGRYWGLYVRGHGGETDVTRGHTPLYVVPVFGLALTLLALVLTYRGQRTSENLEREVRRRTADLRDSHRELTVAVAEMQRSHEDLRRYAKLAAHDLSEPSRGIVSFAQLLSRRLERSNALDGDSQDYLAHLEYAARHMRATVDGFAAYTQVVASPTMFGPVSGRALRQRLVERLFGTGGEEGRASQDDVHLEWGEIADCQGDAARIEEAAYHILRNSLTHGRADRPLRVLVNARIVQDWWIFEVIDNGRGIDPKDRERLTEPFARGRGEWSPVTTAGPGIGLAIARRVAERHGGRLDLATAPSGEGLMVRLMILQEGTRAEEV